MVAATSAWSPRKRAFPQERTLAAGPGPRWILKRNCCLTPRQLLVMYAALCVVSFGIALGFWALGARLVLPFAWIEMAGVGLALWVYARHALDRECIVIEDGQVRIEQEVAGRVSRVTFDATQVRIGQSGGAAALVELMAAGQQVSVGRHVRAQHRAQLAEELRAALRDPYGQG
jgi:uncharacterized membrane protein